MISLHYFFITILLLSSLFVLLSQNPVHSVLFLILAFCNASGILFLFNAEFLGLVFIIIYVGAIAILFLFVVMMLNVKVYYSNTLFYFPFLLLGGLILVLQTFLMLEKVFSNSTFWTTNLPYTFNNYLDNLTSIDVLGQSLYNYYLVCFLLAGLILLVAMVEHLPFKEDVSGSIPLLPSHYRESSSVVRVLACHAKCRGFKSRLSR